MTSIGFTTLDQCLRLHDDGSNGLELHPERQDTWYQGLEVWVVLCAPGYHVRLFLFDRDLRCS